MGERKYGRLFTEADVERIVAEALIRQHTQQTVSKLAAVLEHIEPSEFTFPADEPVFVLRGQDAAAVSTIALYQREARRVGADLEFSVAAGFAAQQMQLWQEGHPDRVKVPD